MFILNLVYGKKSLQLPFATKEEAELAKQRIKNEDMRRWECGWRQRFKFDYAEIVDLNDEEELIQIVDEWEQSNV